jgi:hypothetical protein
MIGVDLGLTSLPTLAQSGGGGGGLANRTYNFGYEETDPLLHAWAAQGWTLTNLVDPTVGKPEAIRAKVIGGSATTEFTFSVVADSITIRYRVSSETNFDKFFVLVDGVIRLTDSGNTGLFEEFTYALTGEAQTITLRYSKDGSGNSGSDTVWISQVYLENAEQLTAIPAPTELDFDSGFPTYFAPANTEGWTITAKADSLNGTTDSLRSKVIAGSASTSFDVAPVGNVTVIRYAADSESFDRLEVQLDAVTKLTASGVAQAFASCVLYTVGSTTITFKYSKDGSTNSGTDSVYISGIKTYAV